MNTAIKGQQLPPYTDRGVAYPHPQNIVSVGQSVDWLTLTTKRQQSRDTVSVMAHRALMDLLDVGHTIGEWERYGYTGWYTDGIRWGRRETDDILQLSSDTAGLQWDRYLPYADNVTRIDLAVTIKFTGDYSPIIPDQYDQLLEMSKSTDLGRGYSLMQGIGQGKTLYVGSRSSAQMGRLYDKHRESRADPHWQYCLRWEVEYKKPLSWEVAVEAGRSKPGDSYFYRRVRAWFADRGVYIPELDFGPVGKLDVPRKQLPDEKRLEWLARQVHPTVSKLVARGLEERVLAVLGLNVSRETISTDKRNYEVSYEGN